MTTFASHWKNNTKSEVTIMAKKKSYQLKNPFIYEGYESPDYFC